MLSTINSRNEFKNDSFNSTSFSICIPIYNGLKQGKNILQRCLDSILKQEYQLNKIEIIIIDDGSKDETMDFLNTYFSNEVSIKHKIISRENLGIADTRIELIQNSNNDYIVFLECDDVLPLNTLKEYDISIQKHPADYVTGNAIQIELNGKIRKFFRSIFLIFFLPPYSVGFSNLRNKENLNWTLSRQKDQYWGKAFRTNFLKNLDYSKLWKKGKYFCDDLIFSNFVNLFVNSINQVKATTYIYWVYATSVSHDRSNPWVKLLPKTLEICKDIFFNDSKLTKLKNYKKIYKYIEKRLIKWTKKEKNL